ncbi:MAG: hypothetical protein JWL81_1203 [Verrucomicrobiales bacterium]|nr:hypothetical protein [Verrucomicrobiales bacterium]
MDAFGVRAACRRFLEGSLLPCAVGWEQQLENPAPIDAGKPAWLERRQAARTPDWGAACAGDADYCQIQMVAVIAVIAVVAVIAVIAVVAVVAVGAVGAVSAVSAVRCVGIGTGLWRGRGPGGISRSGR